MEPKKKRKRIIRPVQKQDNAELVLNVTSGGVVTDITLTNSGPPHRRNFSEVELLRMHPRTPEESIAILNAENTDDSVLWKTQKLSVPEVIERYPLTEEQIKSLKDYEAKNKK